MCSLENHYLIQAKSGKGASRGILTYMALEGCNSAQDCTVGLLRFSAITQLFHLKASVPGSSFLAMNHSHPLHVMQGGICAEGNQES